MRRRDMPIGPVVGFGLLTFFAVWGIGLALQGIGWVPDFLDRVPPHVAAMWAVYGYTEGRKVK